MVLADANVVHHLPQDRMFFTQDLAGQYYVGSRFCTETTGDTVVVTTQNPGRSPYSIRDARTWELLFHSSATDPREMKHKLGAGRRIIFIVAGYGPWTLRKIQGVKPYYAATPGQWFDPTQ